MALQIKSSTFKAKSRTIRSASGETLSRTATKSSRKTKVANAGRFALQNPRLARKVARQKQGRLIQRDMFDDWVNRSPKGNGESLKKGIMGMADTHAGLTIEDSELYYKLSNMDPNKLQAMYERNELIFEVAFNYGGASSDGAMDQRGFGANEVIPGKAQELEFLVEQYERAFGPIL